MEEDNVVVDDGDGSDKRNPSDPPRPWWLPAATILGIAAAVGVVLVAGNLTNNPTDNQGEALPAVETTTTTQAVTTTTIASSTTTTVDVGRVIRDATAFMVSDVRDFCVRASPFKTEGDSPFEPQDIPIVDTDEWTKSLFQDDWYSRSTDFVWEFERAVSEAGETLDSERKFLLESVARHLVAADGALSETLRALSEGRPDEWVYHAARIESSCARARATIAAMLAMSTE